MKDLDEQGQNKTFLEKALMKEEEEEDDCFRTW